MLSRLGFLKESQQPLLGESSDSGNLLNPQKKEDSKNKPNQITQAAQSYLSGASQSPEPITTSKSNSQKMAVAPQKPASKLIPANDNQILRIFKNSQGTIGKDYLPRLEKIIESAGPFNRDERKTTSLLEQLTYCCLIMTETNGSYGSRPVTDYNNETFARLLIKLKSAGADFNESFGKDNLRDHKSYISFNSADLMPASDLPQPLMALTKCLLSDFGKNKNLLHVLLQHDFIPTKIIKLAITSENVRALDSLKQTPLHTAMMHPNAEPIVQTLVEAGAPVNHQDQSGATALICLVRNVNSWGRSWRDQEKNAKILLSIVKYLLGKGADATLTDENGMNARDYLNPIIYPDVDQLLEKNRVKLKEN